MENKSQVEIDFLGLNSTKYEEKKQNNYRDYNRFINSDKEEVETSLSLCSSPSSSSSVDPQEKKKKKKGEFSSNAPCSLVHYSIPNDPNLFLAPKPVYIPKPNLTGFSYILNDPSTNLRCLDRRKINRGHIPTVAMARKATLARFLEKRLHRINQARSPLVIGDTDSETTTSSFKFVQQ